MPRTHRRHGLFAKLFLACRQIAVISIDFLPTSWPLLTTLFFLFQLGPHRGYSAQLCAATARARRLAIAAPVELAARHAVPHTAVAGHARARAASRPRTHCRGADKQDDPLSLQVRGTHGGLHTRHAQHCG